MNEFSDKSIIKRRRVKQEKTFEQRLAEEAVQFKRLADQTPPGVQRELYLRRARQAETASHINDWLKSPGLRPPEELTNLKLQTSRESPAHEGLPGVHREAPQGSSRSRTDPRSHDG